MVRDLEYLVQLQEIDLKIHEQEIAKEQLPVTVQELESALRKADAAVEAAAARLAEAEKESAQFDEQIRQAQENLDKSQTRLNSIKTNREYDAVHAEIEAQKNVIRTSETRKKNFSDDVAALAAAAETARQGAEQLKSEHGPKIAELRGKIDAIDSVIAGILKERETVAPLISKTTLRTYDMIRKRRKNGRVISMVTDTRTCTVCFKVLESQLMNEIKRSSRVIMCQNCGSIFIWSGPLKPAAPAP